MIEILSEIPLSSVQDLGRDGYLRYGVGTSGAMDHVALATANILLRQYGHFIGIGPNFTIIDRADSEGIINLIKSSLGMAGANKRFPSKRMVMNLISGSVNKNTSLEDLVFGGHMHLVEFMDDFKTIAEHYRQFKLDHALMDYDDLLVNWKRLLVESEQARQTLSQRFGHILVDEYQDTNHIQAETVRLLAYTHNNVMVVGDDAQSIYSFRGADFANIMQITPIVLAVPKEVPVKKETRQQSKNMHKVKNRGSI